MNYRKLMTILLVFLCATTAVVQGDTFTWVGETTPLDWDDGDNWDCKGTCTVGYPTYKSDDVTVNDNDDTRVIHIISADLDDLTIEHTDGTEYAIKFYKTDGEGNTITCDTITILGPKTGTTPFSVVIDEGATLRKVGF